MLVGVLLSVLTLGLYLPWFGVDMNRTVLRRMKLLGAGGVYRFEFVGGARDLAIAELRGVVLTVLTLGIYLPWFLIDLAATYASHLRVHAPDGTVFQLEVGRPEPAAHYAVVREYLLTVVTLGLRGPWLSCAIQAFVCSRTRVLANGAPDGHLRFHGTGWDTLVISLRGAVLTLVTLGLYAPWASVAITRYTMQSTGFTVGARSYREDFRATGGQFFVAVVPGGLLSVVTLGLYLPWHIAGFIRFFFGNLEYRAQPTREPS